MVINVQQFVPICSETDFTSMMGNQHEIILFIDLWIMNGDVETSPLVDSPMFTSRSTRKSPPFDRQWFNDSWATFSPSFMGTCGVTQSQMAFNIYSLPRVQSLTLLFYRRQVIVINNKYSSLQERDGRDLSFVGKKFYFLKPFWWNFILKYRNNFGIVFNNLQVSQQISF